MLVGIPRKGFKKEILVASRAQKHKIKSSRLCKNFNVSKNVSLKKMIDVLTERHSVKYPL